MVDWSALTRRLEGCEEGRLELAFVDIERIKGGPLPASSQYPAFWSNSSSYAKAWRRAGFIATRRGMLPERIAFVRSRPADPAPASPPSRLSESPDREAGRPLEPPADVVLVGCVKTKADTERPARELYRSPLFQRRLRYAEQTGKPWYILSAEHGLLDPEALTEPYDGYLADQDEDYRRAWGEWVAAKLRRQLGDLRGRVIEIHASSTYAHAVEDPLRRRGAVVVHPMAGLRQGEQLAWYVTVAHPTGVPARTASICPAASSLHTPCPSPPAPPSHRRREPRYSRLLPALEVSGSQSGPVQPRQAPVEGD